MIHLCSGDMGYQAWGQAGLPGTARIWRDSPAVGPWSPDQRRRAVLRARLWGVEHPETAVREEEETMQLLEHDGNPVLWFSEEPWDQLALLWVVASLARAGSVPTPECVPLHQGGSGVPPEAMWAAFQDRRALPRSEQEEARRLWDRFEAEDWPGLQAWVESGKVLGAMPELRLALARVLEDRAPNRPGRTRRQVQTLMAAGIRDVSGMMKSLAAMETPYGLAWYGDLYVSKLMNEVSVSADS